ncbi:MAG: CHAT domain-containing tetratricopeptide repeat protein [Chloroflexales bacterium]|nr:CHAT domain-containing tetratricopeptide repeat protein [Chloroflexales bacterium]
MENQIKGMDHRELARQLANAEADERAALLDQHTALLDTDLAYALKEVCLDSWSSEPQRSIHTAKALATLAERNADPVISALVAWAAGVAALAAGQMEQAINHLDAAATAFEAMDQAHTAASTQVSKLIALAMLGRYDEAIACGLHARDVFVASGNELAAGKIEQNLGNIYHRRDRYSEAERYYRLARERFAATDAQQLLVTANNGLANVLTLQHKFRAAALLYEQALSLAEASGMEVWCASTEGNLGNFALFQGRYDRALDYLERSRRRYAALGMTHETAIAEMELADAYLELNLIPEAAAIYTRVTSIFAELGMRTEQARALANHGWAYLLLGQASEAYPLLAQAHSIYAAEKNTVGAAMVTLTEAQIHYAEGGHSAAVAAAERSEAEFATAGVWGRLLLARWLRGEALRMLGRLEEAQHLLEAVLRDAEQQVLPQIVQRCHTSLGLLTTATGDTERAETFFKQALSSIEELRAPLPAEEFRTAFVADKQIPYTELIRLSLANRNVCRTSEALGYVERARSRALVEMLGGAVQALPRPRDNFEAELTTRLTELREELNWFYSQINNPQDGETRGPAAMAELHEAVRQRETATQEIIRQLQQRDSGALIHVQPLNLAQLQRDLGAGTALVEYYSLDGVLMAFVVTNEGIEAVHKLGFEQQAEAAVSQLRFQTNALYHGRTRMRHHLPELVKRAQHYLEILYDLLLAPIEDYIGTRRLVIIPHRTLHYIPFHALYDGETYVIEQRELCYAPSANVLHHCLTRPERQLQRALLLGVPDERAPHVRDEVETLAPLFSESLVLREDRATLAALRQHSPEADLVHLACHGTFRPDNPLFSSLRLGDGWLTVRDAYGLDLNCGLVTLSACETGVNAIAPGDELIGLARGFFSAGAPSLLVSLWTVDDATTAELMTSFYTRLQAGDRPAAALRYAQCQLREQHPHPFFWSPFVLLGRW